MTIAIDVHGLKKSYDNVLAVQGIDLQVWQGEVFALLGPNGAGKTTTVEILEGYRQRTAGDVEVLGFDPARGGAPFKRRIGIVLQSTGVEPYLTVAETVELYRGFYPHPRPLDEVIEVVGLQEKRDEQVRKLSGGQQRRLDVAVGLAGDPDLLFLDEPTTGFDPAARRNAWTMIKNLADLGKTIFLTTHYMDEAQNLADRVAIIVAGKIVALGPPSELAGRDAESKISLTLPPDAPALPESIAGLARIDGRSVKFTTSDPEKVLHDLTGWALAHNVQLTSLQVGGATLEDVYLRLTANVGNENGVQPAGTES
ncbi:MAG TPA: ABC transporter ATP-binding protein [Actinomycetota bacterium]|nr:ABC transporter ATP-binding protein [Actinomycetota bacterium]